MALSLRDRFKLGRQIVKRWQDKTWNAMSINLLLRDFGLEEVDFEHWGGNEEIAERVSSARDKQLREMYRTTFGAALEEVDKVARLARCKRRVMEARTTSASSCRTRQSTRHSLERFPLDSRPSAFTGLSRTTRWSQQSPGKTKSSEHYDPPTCLPGSPTQSSTRARGISKKWAGHSDADSRTTS